MEPNQHVRHRDLRSDKRIIRYAIAIGSVLVVLILRSLLHPLLGEKSQYIVFLLAVMVAAWYSGSGAALLSLASGAFLGNLFFVEPYLHFKFEKLNDALAITFYLIVGVAIIYLIHVVRRREDQLNAQIIKQTEVENALRASEERFRIATEALQGAIYDWDSVTDVAYRSPIIFEIVGYKAAEIQDTRRWWLDQVHPDDSERVQQSLQTRIAERASIHSIEYRVRHKDGHYLWVWDKSRIIYTADGQIRRLIGCTLSIDDRKQLAESLARSEERFRLAFENASDAMAISDAAGIVVEANEAYFKLYGYSAEEVIGHEFGIIFPEEQRAENLKIYHQVFNSRLQLSLFNDTTIKRKDGALRIVESRIGFVAQQGQRIYMLSVVRDLTERRHAEKALYARYELTTELAHAITAEDVAQITVDYLMSYLGARAGNVYTYQASDNTFKRLYENAVLSSLEITRWYTFPADPALPITYVVKHNQSLWFATAEEREAVYPSTPGFTPLVTGASVILPLIAASEVFGVVGFLFSENRAFSDDEKVFITSLVFQCAQAIERARLAEKAKELAVMQERHRLARDLHDNVSQLLFSSSVLSEMLPRLLKTKPEKAIQQSEQLYLMVRGAMAEMRTLLWELRPENIIQSQLSNLLIQLSYAARARQEIDITVNTRGNDNVLLPPDVQVAFYRIAQETVHNMLKHSQASVISINLRRTDHYTALVIMDNGQGFDPKVKKPGLGLQNMQERAASIHALFDIKSQFGKGTRTRLLWIPNRINDLV